MATIIGYAKMPQGNISYKGFYFARQFENVCIPQGWESISKKVKK